MSTLIEGNLALILFLPWFFILGTLYWLFPRQPRNAARRLFDIAALLLSVCAFVAAIHWAHAHADLSHGHLWQQILATSVGYGVFLAALLVACLLRWRCFRRP
jgi:hypothetical protein